MGKLTLLKYPNKSHRKIVSLPKHSIRFAEFIGLMMGDGGINNLWQANITLNAIKDSDYAVYVSKLCYDLFGVFPAVRKRKNKQALVISLASTTIIDFLVSSGLPRGNKIKAGLKIPKWILANKSYRIACVRGLMDTDGCLFIHNHRVSGKVYKNIGLCFTSYSVELIIQVVGIFEEFGIPAHINGKGRNIYLYRAESVSKYLKIFGTSNKRISSVYRKWLNK
ncbi:MAG: LAGLIDADG family homing endonuclease [Patescibacteria group bacterium]